LLSFICSIFISAIENEDLNDKLGMDFRLDYTNEEKRVVLQKIADGDQEAFRKFYLFFRNRLIHFAFAMVKGKDSSEEIVEDVFIKLWQSRASLINIENIKVYLYAAVKNTSLNYIAKKARQNITDPFDHINIEQREGQDPEKILITSEMFSRLKAAVDSLPPRCKMIFKLVREDGLKYKEIAEILNISVNTIDAQMAIAVKRISFALRAEVEQDRELRKLRESN